MGGGRRLPPATSTGWAPCARGRHRLRPPHGYVTVAGKVLARRRCRLCPTTMYKRASSSEIRRLGIQAERRV